MVLISKAFPSRFLKGDQVASSEIPVKIREIKTEKAFNRKVRAEEPILVIYFEGKEKGVILKKERANDIKKILGSDNTDEWIGKTVCLYTEKRKTGEGIFDVIRFKEDTKSKLSKELDSIASNS